MLESCWLCIYGDTIWPSFIAQSCWFWENQLKSPSCSFIFTIKREGLDYRVPRLKTNLPAFNFTAQQFFSWTIPPCKILNRKRLMDYLITVLPRKSDDVRTSEDVWSFPLLSARRPLAAFALTDLSCNCAPARLSWNKSSPSLFPYFYARFSTTPVNGCIFLIFWHICL